MEMVPRCSSSAESVNMLSLLKSSFPLLLCWCRINTQIMLVGACNSDDISCHITFVAKNVVWKEHHLSFGKCFQANKN